MFSMMYTYPKAFFLERYALSNGVYNYPFWLHSDRTLGSFKKCNMRNNSMYSSGGDFFSPTNSQSPVKNAHSFRTHPIIILWMVMISKSSTANSIQMTFHTELIPHYYSWFIVQLQCTSMEKVVEILPQYSWSILPMERPQVFDWYPHFVALRNR